jgi:chemotaxis protein MotB
MNIQTIFNSLILFIFCAISLTGCTIVYQKGRQVDVEKISRLKSELTALERAKNELEDRLSGEIADKQVKVEMLEKGLVITFVAEVLFDSGKAVLRDDSFAKIDKVSTVIRTIVPDYGIGIEGHTDNEPIRHSAWKSNWELSSARALSVLHYLEDKGGVEPRRLAATGYGEYRPVASNDDRDGQKKNRRVEIVIIPAVTKKTAEELTQ